MDDLIYKPPETDNHPEGANLYVKFSNNITFLESYLKQNNIDYKPEDLEDTPYGPGLVVRRG